MKKLLLLTTLLTTLFIGFTACSDNMVEDYTEESGGAVLDFGYIYNLNAKLGYDDINDRYILILDENKKKSIIDTLIIRNILIGSDESYESGTFYSGTFYIDYKKSDQDVFSQLKELVGLDISTVLSTRFILDGDDVYENGWSVRLSNISVKTTSRTGQFYPYEPKVFPEAYITVPLSRSSYIPDNQYEVVNVFVHVLRKTNGAGLNKEDVTADVLSALGNFHNANSTNIKFRSIGNEYINYLTDDMIKNLDLTLESERNKIFVRNSHPDALDVYVLSYWDKKYRDANGYYTITLEGVAQGIPSSALILHPEHYKPGDMVPVHEAGHCFGLFHTHYGTAGEGGIPEYVDGSNSKNAGDFLEDTPADPNAWTTKHEYDTSRGLRDGHGDLYAPDPYNVMSYSHNETQRFSPLQIERMHYFLTYNSTVKNMATRLISPTAEELGSQYTGGLHFSERTKTLTFPAIDGEELTWTISHRSSSGNATSQASPKVTTQTGKSITIERSGNADYFEVSVSATKAGLSWHQVAKWKATAGVPSAAVGTLSWTGGDGTSGSFPGYSPTLTLNSFDTSLDLKYTDLANPTYRSGITYRLYTSAGGMLESSYGDFCISEMDCSRGYVEVQAVDNCCGADGIRWRIECQSKWDIFSLDVKDGQLMIDVKAATAQVTTAEKASAKRNLTIKSVKLTTPEGRELVGRTLDTPQRKMSLSTSGMPKGQYLIEITDVDGKVHKGHFGI